MDDVEDIDPETYDGVLNRCPLFRDRRDYAIRPGDTAQREESENMLDHELGEIREVRLRDIWPHEAQDFSTWLALPENLNLLGRALGLNLVPVEQEAAVGDFSLDILAKEGDDGEFVAIENQLEQTNHSHLGQTITYAAEHKAGYVVWIASRFRREHRAAIDWLNELAPEKVWFYAVEVHAIKIGESLPAPDFRPVAVPKRWNGSVMPTPVEAPSLTVIRRRDFFGPLVDELTEYGFGPAEADVDDSQRWFLQNLHDNHRDLWYVSGLDDDGAWVSLWIWTGNKYRQRLYDALRVSKDEIEAEIGSKLAWCKGDSSNGSNISWIIEGSVDDPPDRLAEIRAWMLETLPKFRDVFNPRLEKILAELEEE